MSARAALPGPVLGGTALVAGLVALTTATPALGLLAGALGLAAGLVGLLPSGAPAPARAVDGRADDPEPAPGAEDGDPGAHPVPPAAVEPAVGDPVGSHARPDTDDEPVDTLTDPATGLFSESFFHVAVDSRIAAARRHLRPVAVALLDVVEGLGQGEPSPAAPHIVAEGIRMTLREADTACRLRGGQFALLLEDTPENGAIWTVERIRRRLVSLRPGLTLWAGVACYPAHAFSSEEILSAADAALASAKEWRQDRIEVAVAAAD